MLRGFLVLSTALSMKTSKLRKSLILGLFLSCTLLCLAHIRNLLILGYPTVSLFRFPNYISLTQVKMGGLFQGMEIVITQAFLLCLPIKSAVCLRFVLRALTENKPSTKKIWCVILPIITGVLAYFNTGELYDKIISSPIFKISMSCVMIIIPCTMTTSLLIRKKFNRNKKKAV